MTLAPSPSSKKSSCAERPSSVHTVVLLRALCKRLTLTTLRGPVLKYCQQGAGHLLGYFENGDLGRFAELMNTHWEHKRQRSDLMSNKRIDEWYELARRNGALGGKLIGAGGGGFLMFYAEDRRRLRRAMREAGLHEIRFRFDFEGTKLIAQS